ncbi:uncharacterized protein LOC134259917 [Saccostrea cucullata]|uniref:uncharacterized protein LOC134259917 n=1 Tax=Saccostrea cuccullata TaxID=36930 RepID=UPI002ED67000
MEVLGFIDVPDFLLTLLLILLSLYVFSKCKLRFWRRRGVPYPKMKNGVGKIDLKMQSTSFKNPRTKAKRKNPIEKDKMSPKRKIIKLEEIETEYRTNDNRNPIETNMSLVILAEKVMEYRNLKIGDHICVDGKFKCCGYQHHGIYVGDCTVIHFSGCFGKNAKIKDTDINIFAREGKREITRFQYINCKPPEDVVKVAREFCNGSRIWGKFDLVKNNCEHFATFCKTGNAISEQSERHIEKCLHNLRYKWFSDTVMYSSSCCL